MKIMLDFDLANLYAVETRTLKQAVKRNLNRFPPEFMFELESAEIELLVSQLVIPSRSNLGGSTPFAFTEQGVAMLSAVLRSERAVEISLAIMRAFVLLRQLALSHKELAQKLEVLESRYDQKFDDIHQALQFLILQNEENQRQKHRKKIGFN
jgi:hypothetical protein